MTARARPLLLALLILVLGPVAPAPAHQLGLAQVVATVEGGGAFSLQAKLVGATAAQLPIPPHGCRIADGTHRRLAPDLQVLDARITCDSAVSTAAAVTFPWSVEGALFEIRDGAGASRTFVERRQVGGIVVALSRIMADAEPAAAVAVRYARLGIEHILSGIDHLAVVLLLCLLSRGWRLVKLITAFTIGHSITLALAVLDIVRLPPGPVEAAIALSIAFLAREAFRKADEGRRGVGLIVAFGMLHGLGFASYLAAAGLQRVDLALALVSFNVGIELGQLMFVAVVVVLMASLQRLGAFERTLPRTTAALLGSLAMFWTFERIMAFAV